MTTSLVDYSSSSSDSEQHQKLKRRKVANASTATASGKGPPTLPVLPNAFYSLYATNARSSTADDPSLHGGRTRQIAHREGNWPTHIYLEWYPTDFEELKLLQIIHDAQQAVAAVDSSAEVHSLLRSDLDVQLPLHVSLSAPLVLTTERKDAFQEAVLNAISESGATSHSTNVQNISWVSNSERTRWFLVLRLSRPDNDDLNRLLGACNGCAQRFELAQLYTGRNDAKGDKDDYDSNFHISIAWTVRRPQGTTSESWADALRRGVEVALQDRIAFNTVKLKIGNAVEDIPLLPTKAAQRAGQVLATA
jgi:U6 snRNA phosphodiesterase